MLDVLGKHCLLETAWADCNMELVPLVYAYLVNFVGFGERLADVQVRVPERVVDVTWH